MTTHKLAPLALLLVAPALFSCADEPVRAEVAQGLTSANRLSANRLSANRLSANRLSANRLSANRLSANRLSANLLDAGALLSTEDGREVFTYMVSCALPEGEIVEATVDGVAYEFAGSIGLVPEWADRALTESEKRWVSACLLARVNAYGVTVAVSLRGDHEALAASASEMAAYTLEEGAFYGNVFVPEDQPIEWVACRGRSQAAGESGDLVNRDCAEPAADGRTVCGFTYAGDCMKYSTERSPERACERRSDGHYEDCHTVSGVGRWPAGTERREVITVFVQGS